MLPEFQILTPEDKGEALAALAAVKGAKILAGGTDLLVRMRRGETWSRLVDVSRLGEIRKIETSDSLVRIGGGATHRMVSQDRRLKYAAPSLPSACSQVGSPQIRNMGTIAGNLVNASPCADSIPPLLIHDAQVILESERGSRRVPLEEFVSEPYATLLGHDELLTAVEMVPMEGYREGYRRVAKRASWAVSRLSVAWALREEEGVFQDVKLAIGSCTPMPFRAREAESFLKGKTKEGDAVSKAAEMILDGIRAVSGYRPSYDYKFPVLKGLLEQVLRG